MSPRFSIVPTLGAQHTAIVVMRPRVFGLSLTRAMLRYRLRPMSIGVSCAVDPADLLAPIPPLPGVTTGRHVELRLIDEPLVDLALYSLGAISCSPAYSSGGDGATSACLARLSVAERLVRASTTLQDGLRFVVLDAWRSMSVQRHLFDSYVAELLEANPNWSNGEGQRQAARFVTNPYEVVPPHCTGGAIDLTLCTADGLPVMCGTDFDDFSEKSATRYFEVAVDSGAILRADEETALANRRILFNALTSAGFTNYPAEWWHFDYGDAFWDQAVGCPALYGPADNPKRT